MVLTQWMVGFIFQVGIIALTSTKTVFTSQQTPCKQTNNCLFVCLFVYAGAYQNLIYWRNLGTYPMDGRPWDAISFTFQGGIIAFLDVNKAATLRVHCVYRGRYAHLQIMAQTHWRLLRRPLYFARIISWKSKKRSNF